MFAEHAFIFIIKCLLAAKRLSHKKEFAVQMYEDEIAKRSSKYNMQGRTSVWERTHRLED